MNVADYLGVDNWQGWWDTDEALEELYPDYAKDCDSCQGVAEAMRARIAIATPVVGLLTILVLPAVGLRTVVVHH